jgi:hypothetical protein
MQYTYTQIKMLKTKTTALTLLIIMILAVLPTMLFVNGQVNEIVEEKMVNIAEQAGDRIQNLITSVYADENSTAKIQNVSLSEQFESNVTLYQTEGLDKLATAQEALANSNFEQAADSALEALTIFRQVYSSLKAILEAAGLHANSLVNNQELLDTITRELQSKDTLQNLLPTNATQEIMSLLETANETLLQAEAALQDGKDNEAKTLYLEAKQNIIQIYQYLKTQAEESNIWRLRGYCERLQQRIQERFRYGSDNGVDFTSTLEALGYRNESQFMQELQNKIQNAQSQSGIQNAINDCLIISQMVQKMEQGLNQEINRQQGSSPSNSNSGTSGSDYGAGGTIGGNSANSGGNFNSSTGYNGSGIYGKGSN